MTSNNNTNQANNNYTVEFTPYGNYMYHLNIILKSGYVIHVVCKEASFLFSPDKQLLHYSIYRCTPNIVFNPKEVAAIVHVETN